MRLQKEDLLVTARPQHWVGIASASLKKLDRSD